ncbi:ceramidase-domain-containing protein [Aspergillus insuetus]
MSSIGSVDPFWEAATANSNFCELDYAITRYVAEFINTLTNLVYSKSNIRHSRPPKSLQEARGRYPAHAPILGPHSRWTVFWRIPHDYEVSHADEYVEPNLRSHSYSVYMTNQWSTVDDLAMHFATIPVLHRVLTVNSTRRTSIISAWILACALATLLMFHMVTDELVLHAVCFGVMVTVVGARTMQLVGQRTAPGSEARRSIWGIVRFAAFIFNLGFYLWILDQWACKPLQNARSILGLSLGFVLELHGWWHIFTAIGAYLFIAVVTSSSRERIIASLTTLRGLRVGLRGRCLLGEGRRITIRKSECKDRFLEHGGAARV